MSVEVEGLDELTNKLKQLRENAEAVDGETSLSFNELFTAEFMQIHTDHNSIEEFIEQSPWTVETQEDFERIPENRFDQYVREETSFKSWEGMLSTAANEWVARQISL